jgi:SAM-dependent methyltransferase
MGISDYHRRQSDLSDTEVQRRGIAKINELETIFQFVSKPKIAGDALRVAVLGCADARYIPIHQQLFKEIFQASIEMVTFDITVEHLNNGRGVIKHDCTLPLPKTPFDVIFAHVLLKFLSAEGQTSLLQNAWDALRSGGVAIIINDAEDLQSRAVDARRLRNEMNEKGIPYTEVKVPYGMAWVLTKS